MWKWSLQISTKLKRVKALAKEWSAKLGNSTKQVEQAREDLHKEASLLVKNPHSELLQEKVRVLQANLTEKMGIEVVDLKQRYKINWLKLKIQPPSFLDSLLRLESLEITHSGC